MVVTSEVLAAGHISCTHGKQRNVFSRDLKDPSEWLSLIVFGKVFQVEPKSGQHAWQSPYERTAWTAVYLCTLDTPLE